MNRRQLVAGATALALVGPVATKAKAEEPTEWLFTYIEVEVGLPGSWALAWKTIAKHYRCHEEWAAWKGLGPLRAQSAYQVKASPGFRKWEVVSVFAA